MTDCLHIMEVLQIKNPRLSLNWLRRGFQIWSRRLKPTRKKPPAGRPQTEAQRKLVRFGKEEQRRERALTYKISRSKRSIACSDMLCVDKKDALASCMHQKPNRNPVKRLRFGKEPRTSYRLRRRGGSRYAKYELDVLCRRIYINFEINISNLTSKTKVWA